jgi:hypothetical protein
MKSNVWYLVYYKTIEILFGSLLIASYFIFNGKEAPIAFFLLLTMPTTYLFIFLIDRYQEKSRFLFFVIVFPVIVIGGLLLGFSFIFVLPLSMLIYWRTTILNHDGDSVKTGFWLFITIFVGFILLIIAKINHYPTLNPLIIVMLLQFAFIIFGGFMINWFSIIGNKVEKRLLMRNFLSIIGIMSAISLLLVILRDFIKWSILSVLNLLTLIATFIVSPVFNWVEKYELTGEVNPFTQLQIQNAESDSEDTSFIPDNAQEISQQDFDLTYLYITIALILCTILFIFLYKKFQGSTEVIDQNNQGYFISASFDEEDKGAGLSQDKRNSGQPSNRIRKEIFRLERNAEKLQLGRISSETVGEWFTRIGVEENLFIQSVYEKVRYGNVLASDEEYRLFLKNVEKKKSEFKQIHKRLLSEGKIESPSRLKNMFKGFKSK